MKRLSDLKKSALFVDALLVVGALIAIIGLATFVRLKGTNKPDLTKRADGLAYSVQKLELLPEEANTGESAGNKDSGAKQDGNTNNPAVLDAHTSLPGRDATPTLPPTPATNSPKCDSMLQRRLKDEYRQALEALEKEKEKYTLSGLTSLVKGINEKINKLNNDYHLELERINCPADM